MKLTTYLKELKKCPDERLRGEFGIRDNSGIFLKADFDKVLSHFQKSRNYTFDKRMHKFDTSKMEEIIDEDYKRYSFNYAPGTVKLQIFNWIPQALQTGLGLNKTHEDKIHFDRQKKDYNLSIVFHPYYGNTKKMEGVEDWRRAVSIVLEDITKWTMKQKIPLCIPDSVGEDNKEPFDYSRIVYFPGE